MKTLGINVWPATDLEDVLVFEVEIETPFWCLQQRVHWSDLEQCITEAVSAIIDDATLDL